MIWPEGRFLSQEGWHGASHRGGTLQAWVHCLCPCSCLPRFACSITSACSIERRRIQFAPQLAFGIDALSLTLVRRPEGRGARKPTAPISDRQLLALLEGTLRSLSNLYESLHHSHYSCARPTSVPCLASLPDHASRGSNCECTSSYSNDKGTSWLMPTL